MPTPAATGTAGTCATLIKSTLVVWSASAVAWLLVVLINPIGLTVKIAMPNYLPPESSSIQESQKKNTGAGEIGGEYLC